MSSRLSVARGAAALATSQLIAPVLQAAQLVVVSRFVSPAELSDWVVPAVLLAGESLLLELGLHAVLARRPLLDDDQLARRWAATATAGHVIVLVLGAIVGAPWTALALAILPVAPLSAIAAVGRARLAHADRFARVARLELEAATAATSVVCALVAGIGVGALAAGAVVRASYLMLRVQSAPRHGIERTTARRREAHLVIASYAFVFIAGNADYALAIHLLPHSALGVYFVAFNIAAAPATRVGLAANRMIVARLGVQDPQRVAATLLVVGTIATAAVCAAAPLLPTLLGDAWRSAVEPVRVLASVVTAVIVGNGLRGIAIARRRDRRVLVGSSIAAGLTVLAVLTVGPSTATDLARTVAVAQLASLAPWVWALDRETRRAVATAVAWTTVISGGLLVAAWGDSALTIPLSVAAAILVLASHRSLARDAIRSFTAR